MSQWGDDPLWYQDAIIYELHVKAFFDSDNDGVGDFRGLTAKLDYLQDLGINTLWLLPFYPSPMRDDGYDIADYHNIHPAYGTRQDFRAFIRESHRRGLKVITELVINHTSDQHPWFQAARRAPKGSAKRDYYLWSDTVHRYEATRIIFTDAESSNWTWDPQAQAYYWHRFFSHQPDLNFDNPRVLKAVIRTMRFWMDMGVDGMRLDAIPYLCKREGTSNENLPETHAVIRQIRAVIDARYTHRVLLAEANQWPEDVREYFGNGDECHMAYHFPLMPRLFMSIAQEDRHPIVDILRQTPAIPSNCQWAIFLRNHDELTLEMVTDRERDYMYQMYCNDPRARLNLGIRRRLAPLMDNNRAKIELMTFLLMTLPGSPILYYGDEIGMGDNIYLGDRSGVRTPMQWSPDRNAGFSRADPQQLYLPPIMDPIYGYQAVNVEVQARSSSSLLNWTKRLIAIRKSFRSAGRGTLTLLEPGNRRILAYLREHGEEVVLCVVNLCRSPQAVELNLTAWRGRVPVELTGRSPFPPIEDLPYPLTLSGYGYLAFRLATDAEMPKWHEQRLPERELPVLVLTEGWRTFFRQADGASEVRRALATRTRNQLTDEVLLPYLSNKLWFAAKGHAVKDIELEEVGEWTTAEGNWLLTVLRVECDDIPSQYYFLPLAVAWEEAGRNLVAQLGGWTLARVRQRHRTGIVYGAFGDTAFARALVRAMKENSSLPFGRGTLRATVTAACPPVDDAVAEEVRHPAVEQTNAGVFIGSSLYLKGYHRLQPGLNTELEVGRFLTESSPYPHVAPVLGAAEYVQADSTTMALAILRRHVENQGNAWNHALQFLDQVITEQVIDAGATQLDDVKQYDYYMTLMNTLGRRVAELHHAFSCPTDDPAFAPEPATAGDVRGWAQVVVEGAVLTMQALSQHGQSLTEAGAQLLERLHALDAIRLIEIRVTAHTAQLTDKRIPSRQRLLEGAAETMEDTLLLKTRFHGNLHLGQVLVAGGDFVITDFESEPARPLLERRRKHCPLRDVASMLHSFSGAAAATENSLARKHAAKRELIAAVLARWERRAGDALIQGYLQRAADLPSIPADPSASRALIDMFTLEKALEGLRNELESRPDWLEFRLRGLAALLASQDQGRL